MQFSRSLAASAAALLLAGTTAVPQSAHARDIVGFSGGYAPGTVVVRTSERSLYYVLGNSQAVRYPVGVGRAGKQWSGTAMINGKYLHPAWTPPAAIKHDKPNLPNVIPVAAGETPWAQPRSRSARANTPSMGPTTLLRSGEPCLMVVSACTMRTSSIFTGGSASARRSWSRGKTSRRLPNFAHLQALRRVLSARLANPTKRQG
jgi:L,D-transpeptidase catalytic domain